MNEENNVDKVEDMIDETLDEVEENVETLTDEIREEVTEEINGDIVEETAVVATAAQKVKKHIAAKELVSKAKQLVEVSDKEIDDCKLLLADDLKEFETAKQALKAGGLDEAQALINELGHTLESIEEEEGFVLFDANDDVEPVILKDVSSGRFTGLLLSLLGGAATLGGLVYWATEKLGMTIDLTKIPSNETIQTVFGWFGTQIGRPNDALNGGLVVGAVVLAVMAIIYLIRVATKGSKNLRFAEKQMEETQNYITQKASCKEEMDKVDAHIMDAVKVLKDYEILLNEQAGKLKRILHFEGKKGNSSEYHSKSIEQMRDTQNLIENITRFIATPMSEEGKLSGKSTLFLHSAKEALQKVLAKFS